MRLLTAIMLVVLMFGAAGCGNLSPRFDPKHDQQIDNQNGKIGEIESVQNGIKGEIGTLKTQSEIQNSKLDKIQTGMVNLQSNNAYNGIQILSGPGGLIVGVVGMIILGFVVISYRKKAIDNAKTADMLAEHIVAKGDPALETDVFKAAMHSGVEQNIYDLIKKHRGLK